MKKMIMMILVIIMMIGIFCGCEIHDVGKITVDHLDGTVDIYEYYDGELVDYYTTTKD